jgi:PadR family transcriptional regulator, regulatory protein AphA
MVGAGDGACRAASGHRAPPRPPRDGDVADGPPADRGGVGIGGRAQQGDEPLGGGAGVARGLGLVQRAQPGVHGYPYTPASEYCILRCRTKLPDMLSTTSYAVLGLLALRSWTGYELTQQARRSLARCWPKEDSVLYEEPRRLAAQGLAAAQRERDGGRIRNRYTITDEGRQALSAWLATPGGPPRLELEPLLRLTFADQGELADARAAVAALREWAARSRADGMAVLHGYQAGQAPFPERMHLNVLNACFYKAVYDATLAFCDLADKEIAGWAQTDGLGMTDRTRGLLDRLLADE